MIYIFIASIVIIVAVTVLSLVTTNKAYSYSHTIDSSDNSPYKENDTYENRK